MTNPTLYCPIRGHLEVKAKTSDGLKYTEEKRRIDCIKYLLNKGYPASHFNIESTIIKFGHGGKNSFRSDIVIFSVPYSKISGMKKDEMREHIVVAAEIKRDNKNANEAKETQAKAVLGFLPDLESVGIYWDDIEQVVFYKKIIGSKQKIIEAPIAYLPDFNVKMEFQRLKYNDLEPISNLVLLFRNIEDELHTYISDKSIRYELLLQLLLAKMHDEKRNKKINGVMSIQDFSVFEENKEEVRCIFNKALEGALNIYQNYLPRKVNDHFDISPDGLIEVSRHLAPVNVLESGPEVIQNFYMFFAKQLYKWDLAQYFTPYEVVDFIVRLVNPKFGETIKDPACGSADFLVSALRRGKSFDSDMGDKIHGADNSINAVQVSILNMLLNDDGKSQIKHEDSLENINLNEGKYDIVLCNPPFGVKIQEKRKEVLAKFNMGLGDEVASDGTPLPLCSQQTGILFTELCIRITKPGGRIAIIVPNGYLGNKGDSYRKLRKYIIQHTRIACIVGFPRFTFKKSGADVSASVLLLEKKCKQTDYYEQGGNYPIYFNLLESVGWEIGNKIAKRIYKRNQEDGRLILDSDNSPILDADFDDIFDDVYKSPVIDAFPWLADGVSGASVDDGWSCLSSEITSDPNIILDPKRFCRKFVELQQQIINNGAISLLEICSVVPENSGKKNKSKIYDYIELTDVQDNFYESHPVRGWELPSRAKHKADPGDIFIGSIWSSVKKWFIAGNDVAEKNTIVTNGFYRLKVKSGMQKYLPDLVFALSTEVYRTQMRALATGSDGLAEIPQEDLKKILIPKINDKEIRDVVSKFLSQLLEGSGSLAASAEKLLNEKFPHFIIKKRKTNFSQV